MENIKQMCEKIDANSNENQVFKSINDNFQELEKRIAKLEEKSKSSLRDSEDEINQEFKDIENANELSSQFILKILKKYSAKKADEKKEEEPTTFKKAIRALFNPDTENSKSDEEIKEIKDPDYCKTHSAKYVIAKADYNLDSISETSFEETSDERLKEPNNLWDWCLQNGWNKKFHYYNDSIFSIFPNSNDKVGIYYLTKGDMQLWNEEKLNEFCIKMKRSFGSLMVINISKKIPFDEQLKSFLSFTLYMLTTTDEEIIKESD